MLYIRVFSWKKLKRKTIIILTLLFLIFIMFFIHTSNWSEAIVFKILTEEVVLVIIPSMPSRLFINGDEISEQRIIDEKAPYIIRINADETIHIRAIPIGSDPPV